MSKIVQHYTDETLTEKEYPITVPSAIPISETKDLDDFIADTPEEAPKDGKNYARRYNPTTKKMEWVPAADEELSDKVDNMKVKSDEVISRVLQMIFSNLGNVIAVSVDSEDGYKQMGVPMILYGSGAPNANVRPTNLPDNIPWDGYPYFIGQQYIDIDAASSGLYYAVNNTAVSGWKKA